MPVSRRGSARVLGCLAATIWLAGCGGSAATVQVTETLAGSPAVSTPSAAGSTPSLPPPVATASSGAASSGPGSVPNPTLAAPPTSAGTTTEQAVVATVRSFTYVLSGLDDNLNSAWLQPLADVTTERLAQAVTRQASAMLQAHEHGVGTLAARDVTVKMTGPASAALAECEDYVHFYLADDGTGAPDAGITRGYFVGTAQLVKIKDRWYVDVYATTQTACDWSKR